MLLPSMGEYTPAEFAALFGKERTWAYRQLNAGKVQAITELGLDADPKKRGRAPSWGGWPISGIWGQGWKTEG